MEAELETQAVSWNRLAMDHLRVGHFESALGLLKRAEEELRLAPNFPNKQKLTAITLNNLGCFYKRTKRPTIALHYLRRALEVESTSPVDYSSLAGTHLNICAIRSGLGAHDKALEHAKKAIRLLVSSPTSPNANSTLVIAYHNAGIEFDFLGHPSEAQESYMLGYELAKQTLGVNHTLTETMRQCCEGQDIVRSYRETGKENSQKRPGTNAGGSRSVYAQQLPRISTASHRKRQLNQSFASESPPLLEFSRNTNISNTSTDTHRTVEDLLVGGRVRYITGDRLRPMHKQGTLGRGTARSRPVPPAVSQPPKSVRTRIFQRRYLAYSSPPHSASFSPETETRIQTISSRLIRLQTVLQDFEAVSQATKQAALTPALDEELRAEAATTIQRHVRGFLTRQLLRSRPTPNPALKTLIAPIAPAEDKGQTYHRRTHFITRDQGHFRAIHSCLRTYIIRKAFRQKVTAAVVIQKHIRRYQCRRLYLNIRAALLCLQRAIRTWLRGRI